jgi:hypothetical protein
MPAPIVPWGPPHRPDDDDLTRVKRLEMLNDGWWDSPWLTLLVYVSGFLAAVPGSIVAVFLIGTALTGRAWWPYALLLTALVGIHACLRVVRYQRRRATQPGARGPWTRLRQFNSQRWQAARRASPNLSRPGRYKDVASNLKVKEVRIAEDERFVIRHNPEAAERDAAIRARLIAQLKELIDGSDKLSRDKRAELRGVISTKPGLNRYLRATSGGLLRIDAARARAEENLDGKYLLRTSDPAMTSEDIALGYKQLLQVERGWRDLKQVIDLRPVYHRKEERIRAHVILCWLALLPARTAENACGATWPELRRELGRIAVATFTGPAGTFRQRTEITPLRLASSPGSASTRPRRSTSSPRPSPPASTSTQPRYTPSS